MENLHIKILLNDLKADGNKHQKIEGYLKKVDNQPFIRDYVNNSIGPTHNFLNVKLIETFEINRPGDEIEFRKDLHNRKLLWHGTDKDNLYSILRDGFDLKYANKKRMFGKGIYFSDCCTKSLNYSYFLFWGLGETNYNYLLLCEVALGNIKVYEKSLENAEKLLNDSEDSVMGQGKWSPKIEEHTEDKNSMVCGGKLEKKNEEAVLDYNEFVVYNTNQIQLKYLIKISSVKPKCFKTFFRTFLFNFLTLIAAIIIILIPFIPCLFLDYIVVPERKNTRELIQVLLYCFCLAFEMGILFIFANNERKEPVKKSTRPIKVNQQESGV